MRAVNLIPSEQRGGTPVGSGRSEGGAYALLGLIAGVAVLVLLYGSAHHQISSRQAQADSINNQVEQTKATATQLAPYTSFIALREKREQAVSLLVNSRFDWAHVFHEFGRVLPPEVSVSSLDGTVGTTSSTATPPAGAGASVASATPPGTVPTFTLTGCATSQAVVALTLVRLRLMDGVSNALLQSSTASTSNGASTSGDKRWVPVGLPRLHDSGRVRRSAERNGRRSGVEAGVEGERTSPIRERRP